MKFRRRYPRFTRFSALLPISLAVLILFAGEAVAFLHRVGPLNPAPPVGNFPAWYQDNTGLTLEFCDPKNQSEVNGGWCLLLPGDPPAVPEVFPTAFFDEHFYFAAGADPVLEPGGAGSSLQFARLVLAVEGAFSTGNPVPGAQITFARIRVDFRDVPVTGTYRFIHPYGEEIVDAIAGARIFFTDDVGLGAPGDFSGALGSRLGPFLLPSDTPGGAEMPPLTAANPTPDTNPAHFPGGFPAGVTAYPLNGKSYIADPARLGPVTGSPLPNFIACPSSAPCTLGTGGTSRNHNIWRVEGPPLSNLDGLGHSFIETDNLTLVGRIFTDAIPSEVTVDRADYALNGAGQKVEVFATGLETTQGRLPAQPKPPLVLPQLSFFDAPCTDNNGGPPFGAPVGATETQMFHAGNSFWAQAQLLTPADIPIAVCVKDNVSLTYFRKTVGDEISISEAFFDNNAQSLSVKARSSDEVAPVTLTLGGFGDLTNGVILVSPLAAPPSHVHVNSSAGGSRTQEVTTTIPPATGVTLQATPGSPQFTGTQVAFIAAGQGGTGVYEYKFSDNVTGTMTEKQPYSTSPVMIWPTTVPVGSYAIRVDARSYGSTSLSETDNTIAYTLTIPPPATGVTLFTSPASPQPAGSHVAFLATGQGGTGVYKYQFSDNVTGTMAVTQPYSPTAGWVWNTTGVDNGTYAIKVDVRSGVSGPSEADNTVNFTIAPLPITVALSTIPVSPQAPGTQVVFIANGAGGSGTYEYIFYYQPPAGAWVEGQLYSRASTWTWNTPVGPLGTYNIQVWIRNVGSSALYDNWIGGTYTLASGLPPAPPTLVSLDNSAPSPMAGGNPVDFIAGASGGTPPYEYLFWLQNPSGTWSEGQAYSDNTTWRWNTPAGAPGIYKIQVWTRNVGSTAPYETWREKPFELQ
jgi:hypothetical protein